MRLRLLWEWSALVRLDTGVRYCSKGTSTSLLELRTIRTLDNSDLGQFEPDSDLSCGQFGPWSIRTLVTSDLDHWSIRTP